eukprot:CAMPEP_0181503498 /NCGR_PEP_ID=MMETSP1110-20121109/56958_1 /TAXON_ID=174948 /ORGANISM="Symbiodinium sp., Strain CCMP421" /LENGTH=58 /DNA_ID=CAMNT_0023632223 /DNA_START=46 /DNA_END=219 /DNA_ORIENTATION=-
MRYAVTRSTAAVSLLEKSFGCETLSRRTGSGDSCGRTPNVKMLKPITKGNKLSASALK